MANTTIKITQLPSIGNGLSANTILPVVDTTGVAVTAKVAVGNIANFTLTEAGNLLPPALVSTIAYSVANSAQPNITSVGTLNVNTLRISGGTNGYFLQTNGNGNLAWTAPGGSGNGEVGGANTQIQFNDAGNFGGNAGLTFNKTTGVLTAPFADVSGVANIVGGGATVATKSVLNVASTFGSNNANDPASAQAVRGRVTGSNLTKTRNYVTGVTGQYLVTGTNASEFIKAGVLGVVGDQTTTADGAVVAYLDGDGGLTTANAAYAVSMKNSTPNSGFNYGLDLQFISLNLGGVTTSTFKQADIRFNNGVTLVANTANNISINANVTAGNVLTSAQVIANGVIESGTGFSTGGYLSVDGNTDLHNTVVTGNLSATGNITANNLGNISSINLDGNVSNLLTGNGTYVAIPTVPTVGNIATLNLDGSNSNVLYGNGVFAAVAGGANTGNVTFNDINIIGTGNLKLQPDSANANAYLDIYLTGGPDIHIAGNGETVILGTDNFANVAVNVNGNVSIQAGDANGTQTWNFGTDGNITLPRGGVVYETNIPDGGLNGNTIALAPSGGTNADQQLLIYPTTNDANHLHLTSGNLYSTELFLGDDNLYVKLANTGNIVINSNDGAGNTAQWTFDVDGNLTIPGSLINDTSIVLSAPAVFNICTIATAGSGYNTGSSLKATTGGSGSGMTVGIGYGLSNQLTSVNVVDPGTGYVNGDVITVSEGTGGTFVLTKYNQSANQTNNNTIQTDFTFANSTVTLPIYGEMATDASMTLTTNLANAGNTSSWTFGDDGKLTFPGTPRIDTDANNFEVQAAEAINFEANTVVNIYTDAGNNAYQWQFGDDGNLTLPDTTSVLANVNITLEANDTGNITGLNLIGDSNANLYAHGNVKIVSDSSNTTATWTFGADGNLTIPGTSGGFIKTASNASIGIVAMDNGTNNPAQLLSMNVGNGNATSIVSAYATNATIQTNASGNINTWAFDNAGNLTLPTGGQIIVSGGLVSSGASPAPTINGFSITNSVGISGNGNIAGNNISATGNISANNFTGNGGTLSNVATKTSGSWTLASGVNTVSISIPLNGTYAIWINGNIPNGIITYTATAVITNTNVPVLGSQYAWYYAVGNALVLTSIPDQFTGTVGSISNVNTYAGNTANVFTFGITNNSGNTAVVNYGYTKL